MWEDSFTGIVSYKSVRTPVALTRSHRKVEYKCSIGIDNGLKANR